MRQSWLQVQVSVLWIIQQFKIIMLKLQTMQEKLSVPMGMILKLKIIQSSQFLE